MYTYDRITTARIVQFYDALATTDVTIAFPVFAVKRDKLGYEGFNPIHCTHCRIQALVSTQLNNLPEIFSQASKSDSINQARLIYDKTIVSIMSPLSIIRKQANVELTDFFWS